ncbi:HisA/HisF-related TIM barrel protein [Neorhodopirellula pilleata]|uniref:1-(5-phosphoribosyl)-5-[(5-phosphoribosylamino)methylideneamino] imidazole-4-carboxamide isomerase n=1 Tax=Neorhodopirellula pilleata TaxID=2714738 RepID=A0A5C5ZYZ9_9BACT|nr:HisA/HisF-related TIM barrel protein [Neorhodopirellula pilleata]TWT92281.1 1-(5-phosphoribosyl)-5-[(5-phosphoribosylamino)methylideneamino] imidazole-4-carboxamide isomerase [Neorhodopirellula pilleata]
MDWKSVADRIVGVIDLKNHVAVHGIAGQRHLYRPVELSRFASGSSSRTIDGDAIGLINHYRQRGIHRFYVADLDALSGGAVQTRRLEDLIADSHAHHRRPGEQWILDVGLNENVDADDLAWLLDLNRRSCGSISWVVASESSLSDQTVSSLAKTIDPASMVLGIDLRQGKLNVGTTGFAGSKKNDPSADPIDQRTVTQRTVTQRTITQRTLDQWVESGREAGVEAALVLDVSAVGTASGPAAIDCCQQLHQRFPSWRLISGGGCRSAADVATYLEAGCNECLVATALHR